MFVAVTAVTAGIMAGVFTLGTNAIRNVLLKENASQIASWYSGAVRAAHGNLDQIISGLDHPVEIEAMQTARIDSLLLVEQSGRIVPIVGTAGDEPDFRAAVATGRQATDKAIPSWAQVYTQDTVSWLNPGPFRVWVLLGGDEVGGRLAARISNLKAPAALVKAFQLDLPIRAASRWWLSSPLWEATRIGPSGSTTRTSKSVIWLCTTS
jgi:hypothetical protein